LLEDTYIHDRFSAVTAASAGFVTLRRFHVKNYSETIFNSGTTILAEDSLFEDLTAGSSDALEIQGGPPGSVVRRCTFRRSTGVNSDAVDFNGTSGAMVESCLIHHCTDKGISLGAAAANGATDANIVVSNCLIYAVGTGIAIKDDSTAGLFNNTVTESAIGFHLYNKFFPPVRAGRTRQQRLQQHPLGNTASAILTNGSTLRWIIAIYRAPTGRAGNISADPLFANPAWHDYRLGAGSPAIGSGLAGASMGVTFPSEASLLRP